MSRCWRKLLHRIAFCGTCVFVLGTVVKGATPPVFVWATKPPTLSLGRIVTGITTDTNRNCYLSGYWEGGPPSVIFNVSRDGTWQWIRTNYAKENRCVAVDLSQAVYLGGAFYYRFGFGTNLIEDLGQTDNLFLAKYDANGAPAWFRLGETNQTGGANALAFDTNGNLLLGGRLSGAYLAKFDSSGTLLWSSQVQTSYGSARSVDHLSVNAAGYCVVVGTTGGGTPLYPTFVFGVDLDGRGYWTNYITQSWEDSFHARVAVDAGGNAYVAGRAAGRVDFGTATFTSSGYDGYLAKYDRSGTLQWVQRFRDFSGYDEMIEDVVIDREGNPHILGSTYGRFNQAQLAGVPISRIGDQWNVVAKLSPAGELLWHREFGPTRYNRIAVDARSDVIVGGDLVGAGGVTNSQFGTLTLRAGDNNDVYAAKLQNEVPGITNQPRNQIVVAGTGVALNVGASGTSPLSYQWRKDGVLLTTGTNASLSILNSAPSHSGDYTVIVSNVAGVVTSSVASIRVQYQLTAKTDGGGVITGLSSNGLFEPNTPVTLAATAASGWRFLQWLGDTNSTNVTLNISMNQHFCFRAMFGITIATSITGFGSIHVAPLANEYPYGTVLTLTAIPQSGSYLLGWGNSATSAVNPLKFTLTNASPNFSAIFEPLNSGEFALTVIPSGRGRVIVIPAGNRFASNQSVSLTAIPEERQMFTGWSGDTIGTQTNVAVLLSQSKIVTANFTTKPILFIDPCAGGFRDDSFRFTLNGDFGAVYQVDYGSSFTNWSPIGFVTNLFGTSEFIDESALTRLRTFYRAQRLPR